MNYAFVPGGDLAINPNRPAPAAAVHRTLFSRKPFMELISKPQLTTVKHFVDELAKLPSGSVNDIYIACHGTTLGSLMIALLPGGPGESQYEDVEKTVSNDASRSIKIPSAILGGATNSVHLRACSIGQAPKFLRKLKEAFGGQVSVTAPKYIHFITDQEPIHTSVEYLLYDFNISLPALPPTATQPDPQPVTDRATIVQAFKARQTEFKLINGKQVPQSAWDDKEVIPKTIASVRSKAFPIALKAPLGRLKTLPAYRDFQIVRNKAPPCTMQFNDLKTVPTDPIERMAKVKATLATDTRFTSTFPLWERQGFTSLDAYINAFYWDFRVEPPTGSADPFFKLLAFGTRHIYSVQFPITENPPTKPLWGGKLIMNAYPASDPPSNPVVVPVNDLETSNPLFFTTV